MFSASMNRLLQSYPKIYLACHTRHLRDDASGRPMTAHLCRVLDHLSVESPLSISELARHLDVTQSTISLQVSKLERLGCVRRFPDPRDRRHVRVRLTEHGLRIKRQNSVLDPDLVKQLISLLPSGETEAALRGLELLAQASEKLMQRRQIRRSRKSA